MKLVELDRTRNDIKMLTVVRRMFSKKARVSMKSMRPKIPNNPLAGIRSKIEVTENEEDIETFDPEDTGEFEADFMEINKTHRMHVWYAMSIRKSCMHARYSAMTHFT